jgi:hypothetical protein
LHKKELGADINVKSEGEGDSSDSCDIEIRDEMTGGE